MALEIAQLKGYQDSLRISSATVGMTIDATPMTYSLPFINGSPCIDTDVGLPISPIFGV